MSNGYKGEGASINYTATGAVTEGALIQFTNIIGVALNTATTGATVPCGIVGEYTIAKTAGSANAFTLGDLVYVTSAGAITNVATSNKQVGHASAVAATGDSSVTVILSS